MRHTEAIKIYKSSAGSGKTFALVLEYLTILLTKPTAYREILAVTFTNKATNEMKRRIIDALATFAKAEGEALEKNALFQQLYRRLSEIDAEAAGQIQRRASYALEEILNDYSNFSVSTIESFFQRIVRAFARELNLPMGYDIQTEMEIVKEQIVQNLYLDIGNRSALTELFKRFLISNMNEEKSWNFEPAIKNIGNELFKEAFQRRSIDRVGKRSEPQAVLELASKIQQIKFRFERHLNSLGKKGLELMESHHLTIEDFKYGNSGVAGYIHKLTLTTTTSGSDFFPGVRVQQALQSEEAWYTKKSPRQADILAALSNGLYDLLGEIVEYINNHYAEYESALSVYKNLYSFGMMNDLAEKLNEYRREQNEMIISDTSFLLHTIVNDSEDELGLLTPFIYEKVGVRYQYYLLDEFQDTSEMQWQNLFPLMIEALSKADKLSRVGIMGDVKQSIYRWRNGRMQLLLNEVENQIANVTRQAASIVELDNNWRTSKEIVDFNNQFFSLAADLLAAKFPENLDLFSRAYSNVVQKAQKTEVPSLVSLKAFKKVEEKGEKQSWENQAKEECYQLIHKLFQDGFKGEDIVLLVRNNKDGITMAEYLQQRNIKVVSAESLLLAKHPQVQFYIAFFKFLLRPQQEINRKSLQYFFIILSETHEIDHELFSTEIDTLWSVVNGHLAKLNRLPLYELAEYIRQLFSFLGEANAYLQGLMDTIWEYTARFDASLGGFLEWWEEIKEKRGINVAAEPEAVQIMTIHKAKGLEFPIVILPLADWSFEPKSGSILWVETPVGTIFDAFPYLPISFSASISHSFFGSAYEEERRLSYLDNLNLLYVAFTRPQYQLHIFTEEASKEKQKNLKSISALLTHMMNQQEMVGTHSTSPLQFSSGSYIANPKDSRGLSSHSQAKSVKVNHIAGIGWGAPIQIKYTANRYLPTDWVNQYQKISAGELMHEALSHVYVAEDVAVAAKQMFLLGYIPEGEVPTLARQLEKIISFEPVKNWYLGDWDVRNEREIINSVGVLLRPDRIMLSQDEMIVVDYKTGAPHPQYIQQVQRYIYALKELNSKQTKGYLYYLHTREVQQVLVEQ